MDHFRYRDSCLFAEDVSLDVIAADVATPFYVYSTATVERHYRVFAEALAAFSPTVCYAVKANGNLAVIATLARMGAGADVTSGGELATALAAGIPAERIVFSGVGKSSEEMRQALRAGVLQLNVESEAELESLDAIARSLGVRAPVALRVNPDVDAHTHDKISTGRQEDKFGIEWTAAHRIYARASALPGLDVVGVAVHIGSQLTDTGPFREAFARVRDLVAMLRADGLSIRTLDLGGGLGVPYGNEGLDVPEPRAYAQAVAETVGDLGCRLIFEPGRMIVGNAGVLVTRVLRVKEGAMRTFVIVDAGMNDLMRPALYDAWHAIVPVRAPAEDTPLRTVDIVGPVCETSDTFGTGRLLAAVSAGDLLAIRTAGAYGRSMASAYNARPLAPEILVHGRRWAVVNERVTVEQMLARQHLPSWLTAGPDTRRDKTDDLAMEPAAVAAGRSR
ncbi:MAG: diaminopimelate decarboxylase [Rhodospirillales bacterium]|nr:diaminopimelate decarboxylase [Rhodospirillales bacterium]